MKSIEDLYLVGKKVLLRADYNVPIDEKGNILNYRKIVLTKYTIQYILEKNPKQIILISHLGRPQGRRVKELSLYKVAKELENILQVPVARLDDCIDIEIPNSKIVLLENLRFHPEEENDDESFAKKLASLGDLYINDAFSVSHRKNASVHAITKHIDSAAGPLFSKEIKNLEYLLKSPERPFVIIQGGSKVSDKIKYIENLMPRCDHLLVGGALANELKSSNYVEIREKYQDKLTMPIDLVVIDDISGDIGIKTIEEFKSKLKTAKTILWNGPLGIFEKEEFSNGSREIARFLSNLDATKIICGGESSALVESLGLEENMTYVSTSGGAALEFLEGKRLPGLEALNYY